VYAVQAGQAYSHADELSRGRPAPADATLARNRVPLKPLTVSSLQNRTAGEPTIGPARLVNAFRARVHDLVAERYRLSEFLQNAWNRTPIISADQVGGLDG
jgi:hypothetical protein